MKREFIVGVVFFVLLALLLASTLWINDSGFLSGRTKHELTTSFREVAGLSAGDSVWVYGTEAGRVTRVEPNGKGGVDVQLALDYDPQLHEDATVRVQSRSALGGAVVAIHPGDPSLPLLPAGVVQGTTQADAFGEVGALAAQIRGPLTEAVENIRKISADMSSRSENIADNLDQFAENARVITDDIRAGKGSLGQLLGDAQLYTDLQAAVDTLKQVADDARSGGGTIDVLLHDQEMANGLRDSVRNLNTVTARLERGEGTLGKLLRDDEIYDDLKSTTTDLRQFATDARGGKGLLGRLVYDEELSNRMDKISRDVSQVTGRLRRGEGTLGKLIQDEELYLELRDAMQTLTAGAGDARENAPILTFAGFLFGGF